MMVVIKSHVAFRSTFVGSAGNHCFGCDVYVWGTLYLLWSLVDQSWAGGNLRVALWVRGKYLEEMTVVDKG